MIRAAALALESAHSVREAGLRYVSDRSPGIRRVRRGKGFAYRAPDGRLLHNRQILRRIESLVIPPAWEDVWICPLTNGHIQAVGRDSRGRKQYRYHPQWNAVRNRTKFDRLAMFGHLLPRMRRLTDHHLRQTVLSRDRVMAAVVRLLEQTCIRVGNEEYAVSNGSYGLTTIRDHHVRVKGSTIRFQFTGKHARRHEVEICEPRLARIVSRCQDLPGQELFKYIDEDGVVRDVNSGDVNDYIRKIAGRDFTAKDFRTWKGTTQAAAELQRLGPFGSPTQARRNIVEAVKHVAQCLNNRPATCRKYYIHPAILQAYENGTLLREMNRPTLVGGRTARFGLSPSEKSVLRILAGAGRRRAR